MITVKGWHNRLMWAGKAFSAKEIRCPGVVSGSSLRSLAVSCTGDSFYETRRECCLWLSRALPRSVYAGKTCAPFLWIFRRLQLTPGQPPRTAWPFLTLVGRLLRGTSFKKQKSFTPPKLILCFSSPGISGFKRGESWELRGCRSCERILSAPSFWAPGATFPVSTRFRRVVCGRQRGEEGLHLSQL